ncbi:hypothetical protein [Natronorubrum thiooxidans]|nr:hypothetical protein [Natronorubrum thiooxidans]
MEPDRVDTGDRGSFSPQKINPEEFENARVRNRVMRRVVDLCEADPEVRAMLLTPFIELKENTGQDYSDLRDDISEASPAEIEQRLRDIPNSTG